MPFMPPKPPTVERPCEGSINGRRPVSGDPLCPCCSMEDVAMRTMKLDPFWRTSVGFDRLFDLMDESLRYEPEDHYPPCNIVRTGEDAYRVSLAVAGFKPEQIGVTVYQNTLTIAGRVNERQGDAEYLYRGIAGRPLRRTYGERRNFGTPTSA